MNIFVINTGSSSIKYQLFKMPNTIPICSGLVERIGMTNAGIIHKTFINGIESIIKKKINLPNHEAGLQEVVKLLSNKDCGVIKNTNEIDAVGHRVVHGGESFKNTTIITTGVKAKIKQLFSLAPLHNPANFLGIEVAEKIFTHAKQIAVFDTAFYQTMPEKAFRFAIPDEFYHEHLIRVYGFHGSSHKYVSEIAATYLNNKKAKIISIHLGNGCSITAIEAGKAVDTSMGFGPNSGLVMGTRSGDIDVAVIFYMIEKLGYTAAEVSDLLNKKSGMAGLTGFSDMRDINNAVAAGNKQAALAIDLYTYKIKKQIGAYAAALNGIDAIIFTAGVGENAHIIRQKICTKMEFLGLQLDENKNNQITHAIREINIENAPVKILVIPTNEELEIVKQCYELLKKGKIIN